MIAAVCAAAVMVTVRAPALTVSCACSLVCVGPGAGIVHEADFSRLGQLVVNWAAWPDSRTVTFPYGQFLAQTWTVNCAGWPWATLLASGVTLRHRLGGVLITSATGAARAALDCAGVGVTVGDGLGELLGLGLGEPLGLGLGVLLGLGDVLGVALGLGLGDAATGCSHMELGGVAECCRLMAVSDSRMPPPARAAVTCARRMRGPRFAGTAYSYPHIAVVVSNLCCLT